MKKLFCAVLALLLSASLYGCSAPQKTTAHGNASKKSVTDIIDERTDSGKEETSSSAGKTYEKSTADREPVDVDLTTMNSTMVYTEVNQMLTTPEQYMGKTVRMKGSFTYSGSEEKYYFACIIADATACCSQGLEFDLKDGWKFPDEYPDPGTEITVSGIFNTYDEGDMRYCQLKDAVLE